MQIAAYYDYTCPYSYKGFQWTEQVRGQLQDFEVAWRTFSLKESNRAPTDPSAFAEPFGVSVLALALAQAARDADFESYHRAVFTAMHEGGRRPGEAELLAFARDAGVDTDAFDRDRARWVDAVAREHRGGADRWEIFGTPTFVLGEETAVFLKFAEPPASSEDAHDLWQSLCTISVCHPELVEIKRPG